MSKQSRPTFPRSSLNKYQYLDDIHHKIKCLEKIEDSNMDENQNQCCHDDLGGPKMHVVDNNHEKQQNKQ